MNRAAIVAVALWLIVGGLGASVAFGDFLGMFSRGLGATGWIIFALASCAYAGTLSYSPRLARAIVVTHRSFST